MDKMDGYEIQKTILFETVYGFALGCVPGTPEKSAVWTLSYAHGVRYFIPHLLIKGQMEDYELKPAYFFVNGCQ